MKDLDVKDIEDLKGDTEKHQTALMVFRTYLCQRFSIVMFGLLALYILTFTKINLTFHAPDGLAFMIALLFLMTMRLYDDLQNAKFDHDKPNRIYTDPANTISLYTFVAAGAVLVLSLLPVKNLSSAAVFLLFLLVNHILYSVLVNRFAWRYYLPLLKYPIIAGLIGSDWSIANLSLFFVFLTFDLIDDPSFPLPAWSKIISSLIAFALLLPSTSESHIVQLGGVAILAAGITLLRFRYSGYLFLGLFLLARLIDPLYEI